MSVHTETVMTVIGTGLGVATVVVGSVRKLAKSLGRIGDMLEDFRGRPADPARGLMEPKPGVMQQLGELNQRTSQLTRQTQTLSRQTQQLSDKTSALDRGQLRIIDDISKMKQQLPPGR